jgi:hypothetical protein
VVLVIILNNVTLYIVSKSGDIRKGKAVPVLNQVLRHEDVWGSGGVAPCIPNLSSRQR